MRAWISPVLASLALLTADGVGAAPAPSQFPLAAGNTWYLADAENGAGSQVSVHARANGLLLRGFPGSGDLRVRRAGLAVEAWDPADGRWEAFLRLGAPAGTHYKVDLARTGLWRNLVVTVASRKLEVEDARGRSLRGCVRLTFRNPKGLADAGLEELVFAPGVGIVRIAEMTIAGTRTRLLDRFIPGATR
jgi:hypothetical protein